MSILDEAKLTEYYPSFEEQAATRLLNGDPTGASWVFHHCMTQADRDAFDQELVRNKHPLSYEAGTQESRFIQCAQELVKEFHEMEAAYKAAGLD
ncbi:MAG: hypothetical protein ACR2P5_04685 [Gammaproteobacteria bacterium]